MPDFGENWKWIKDLNEGGQAHTFLVRRAQDDGGQYVLKRLKNLKRIERFDREIQACMALDHPNVLHIVDYEERPKKGNPFLVTEYCSGGPLSEKKDHLGTVLEVLLIFRQICAGAANAHENNIVHRDIKPDNIFFRQDGTAVLGDFGICFFQEDGTRLTATEEVAGSRWYCAPELRDGRPLRSGIPITAADVYSLAKVLYWMLSGGRMFDRELHRDEHFRLGRNDHAPEYELVNQLLDKTIVEDPSERVLGAPQLLGRVDTLIGVIRAGGRAITLTTPQRCLFCAQGEYKIVVDGTQPGRLNPRNPGDLRNYQSLAAEQARSLFGYSGTPSPIWLILVCQACGNVQTFRPDFAPNGLKNWRPN